MNEQEQRIAIAEACGCKWSKPHFGHDGRWHSTPYWDNHDMWDDDSSAWAGKPTDVIQEWEELPDYLHDLNAMHEAEKTLDDEFNLLEAKDGHETRMDRYIWNLEQVVFEVTAEDDNYKACVTAIAAQRAEAFLRTLNLWKE